MQRRLQVFPVAIFSLAAALTGCSGSDDDTPESDETTTAEDTSDTTDPESDDDEGSESTNQSAGTATVPDTCSDDVISLLSDHAGDEEVHNLPPTDGDPDLVCSFFAGDQNSAAVGVIISTSESIDWSQLGDVNTSEVTVAGFDGELADLVGAGQALVVDLDGVYVTVNVGKDAKVGDEDLNALAEAAVLSTLE